ncbi:AIPR family protein [Neisseria animaloris]|uniref:AIPR protein n=1 Tax=Neisseria animaloris TaxID=326522 RepID=A0A448UEG3_9NEIS|nr:AIPR family protein [Neisseria animaloris]VEJ22272.1 AIPR protein [Neisseria animaloris]
MANINQFKTLHKKCIKSFEQISNYSENYSKITDDTEKARYGFYLLMLENITGIQDTSDLLEMILDYDFNSRLFNEKSEDAGIDAFYIDREKEGEKIIHVFNFKYREKFNNDKEQSLNESLSSIKFFNALITEETQHLKGCVKNAAQTIIEALLSNDIYRFIFHIVSNENKTLSINTPSLEQLKKLYSLEINTIGLNEISEIILVRPEPVNATLLLDAEAVMPYREDPINSNVSYILRLNLLDLLRITCTDKNLRNKPLLEKEESNSLTNQDIDYGVLYDNVRGFVTKSKFNPNISRTLNNESQKFFIYNNGLTLIAKNITAQPVNASKKYDIKLHDFQVINGGQTLRSLHNFNKDNSEHITKLSNGEVLVRVFKFSDDEERNKIAEYTNSQNAISNIDLKSIRSEQILLEKYLSEEDIFYSRKKGDLGNSDKPYKFKISMEKFGQILFSLRQPHQASNKKKEIFGEFYDEIFGESNLKIDQSSIYINQYFNIEKHYKELSQTEGYKKTDQKYFYIIYMINNFQKFENDIPSAIKILEQSLKEFVPASDISEARKLIQLKFKNYLDEKVGNLNSNFRESTNNLL